MRHIAAWLVLMIAAGAFIAMVISTWRHQVSVASGARHNAVELVWSLIPWLIVALCITPAASTLGSTG